MRDTVSAGYQLGQGMSRPLGYRIDSKGRCAQRIFETNGLVRQDVRPGSWVEGINMGRLDSGRRLRGMINAFTVPYLMGGNPEALLGAPY